MRLTNRHVGIAMLGIAAAVITIASVNPVDTAPDAFESTVSETSAAPNSNSPGTEDPTASTTNQPVITLGDLDPTPAGTP